MLDEGEIEYNVWYSKDADCIRFRVGGDRLDITDLDIRDAVYFRYMLDGAISDYERAVGR